MRSSKTTVTKLSKIANYYQIEFLNTVDRKAFDLFLEKRMLPVSADVWERAGRKISFRIEPVSVAEARRAVMILDHELASFLHFHDTKGIYKRINVYAWGV